MKKTLLTIFCALSACFVMNAQTTDENEEVLFIIPEVQVDSTMDGMSIADAMPANVSIKHSAKVSGALLTQIENNSRKQFTGYRIRIYFDSKQGAREESVAVLNAFRASYPEISAYRSYSAPNFKVTVGNFRNRADADAALARIKAVYPSAFVVREKFKYPSVGRFKDKADTLRVATAIDGIE